MTSKKKKKDCEIATVQAWTCPICYIPLTEGERCDDGVMIEGVPLMEVGDYLHDFNWEMFSLRLLEVKPEYDDMENQRAVFLIVPPVEPQKRDVWLNIYLPEEIDRETVEWALWELIYQYKYGRDCTLIDELREKYGKMIKGWKKTEVRITPNQRRYISSAAKYWGLDMRTVSSLFVAYILYDEMFRPDTELELDEGEEEVVAVLNPEEVKGKQIEEIRDYVKEKLEKAEK